MVSLGSSPIRPPAGDLQRPQVKSKKSAQRAKLRGSAWFLGSWNVRSLLDCEGPVETARQRSEMGVSEDRRIDQVLRVLERDIRSL